MKKVYEVTLHSRGGKKIYVESITRKQAVESADRLAWGCAKDLEWRREKWYRPIIRFIFGPPKFNYPGPKLGDY